MELKNTVLEAVPNMGSAKPIVIRDLSQDLKWKVETPLEGKSYGSYLGLGGKPTKHYSCIPGPLRIILSQKIVVNVCEIKVIEHPEPLFLI